MSTPAEPAPAGQPPEIPGPAEQVGSTEAAEPTPAGKPPENTEPAVPAPAGETAEPVRRTGIRALLARIPHPPWQSRRGILLRFLLIAGFGSIATIGMISASHYTETASFCGRCHTMGPELKAHAMSPHSKLSCAECHIEPGTAGLIKAKIRGTKQLIQVITGTFPKPIPPPDHSQLPPVTDTCLRCHSLDDITQNGGPVKLVLRPRFQADESNTRELIAVVIRPSGLGGEGAAQGVHWHVQQTVSYTSTDDAASKINLIEITRPDGSTEQYVASAEVGVSTDAQSDVDRIRAGRPSRRMDCIDCHNRVGHSVPSIEQAVDDAIASGRISTKLPFIKRDAVALLGADYPTLAQADQAIDGLSAG